MVFVPSVDGISHSPAELSEWQDCVNGANVLLKAMSIFAGQFLS
jgi:N-carbamoyl-L-amino-acid hydrolase